MGTKFTDTARTPAATSKIPIELADGSKGYCTPITLVSGKAHFKANKNATNQTDLANGLFTKLTFTNELTDQGSYYDAANSKWTPPAGAVRISAKMSCSSVLATGGVQIIIYKNGSAFAAGLYLGTINGGTSSGSIVTATDVANGTDYYEAYAYADATVNATASGGVTATWFEGEQI